MGLSLTALSQEAEARAKAAEARIRAMEAKGKDVRPRVRSPVRRSGSRTPPRRSRSRVPALRARSRTPERPRSGSSARRTPLRSRSRSRRSWDGRSRGRRSRDRRSRDRRSRDRWSESEDSGRRGRRPSGRRSRRSGSRSDSLIRRVQKVEAKVEKSNLSWLKETNRKQHEYNMGVRGILVEDLAVELAKHFVDGEIPVSVKAVIEKGEKAIDERTVDLRRADKVSWRAVELMKQDPLCNNESEDKRWRRACKEDEEERKKKRETGAAARGRGRGGRGASFGGRGASYGGGYGHGGRGGGYGGRGGGYGGRGGGFGGYDSYGGGYGGYGAPGARYGRESQVVADTAISPGEEPATFVGREVTTRPRALCAAPEGEVAGVVARAESAREDDFIETVNPHDKSVPVAEPIEAGVIDVMVAERALIKLDKLEGAVSLSESKGDEIVIFEDDVEAGEKVTSTLKSHYDYWEKTGASEFAKSVIRNGYIPAFSEMPPRYREPNNKS